VFVASMAALPAAWRAGAGNATASVEETIEQFVWRAVCSAYPAVRHTTPIGGERVDLETRQTTFIFLRLAAQAGRSEHVQRPPTLRSKPRTPIRPHKAQCRKTGSTSRILIPLPSVGSRNACVMSIGH